MIRSPRALRRLLPALLLSTAMPVGAQISQRATVQALPRADDPAESLATALRTLATAPNNVEALMAAGHNALALGDPDAAVGFFGRAQGLAPGDGRAKAGLGSALVQMQKPQDALRLFDDAVRLGVPEVDVARDRGLAYDLTGSPRRAQRDYQMVLDKTPGDDVARRRMALSQGISGDKAAALATLDPLIRKRDIAGWRAQTFVLAMSGDAKGASDITHVMLPQQADMLQPFLVRLPSLTSAEKARAVHFGEMPSARKNYSSTDLANLGPAPTYASAPPPRTVQALGVSTRPPTAATPTELAAQTPSDTPSDLAMPVPAASGHYDLPHVAAERARGRSSTSVPIPTKPLSVPVVHADSMRDAVTPVQAPPRSDLSPPAPVMAAKQPSPPVAVAPIPGPTPTPTASMSSPVPAAGPLAASVGTVVPSPAPTSSFVPSTASPPATAPASVAGPVATPPSAPSSAVAPATGAAPVPTALSPLPAKPVLIGPPAPRGDERIETVDLPASPPPPAVRSAPAPQAKPAIASSQSLSPPAPKIVARAPIVKPVAKTVGTPVLHGDAETIARANLDAQAKSDEKSASKDDHRDQSDTARAGGRLKAEAHEGETKSTHGHLSKPSTNASRPVDDMEPESPTKAKGTKAAKGHKPDRTETNDTAPSGKTISARKSKERLHSADEETSSSIHRHGDTSEALSNDTSRHSTTRGTSKSKSRAVPKDEPPHVYVQVAGGANRDDMDKAWTSVKKKAPDLMKGKVASTAPIRATNRLVVGPFKDEAEAQSFVNKASGKGVSAFVVKSEKGQKFEKLSGDK